MSMAEHSNAARIGSRELAGEDKPQKPEQMHDGKVSGMHIRRGAKGGYTAHHEHKHKETGHVMKDEDPHVIPNQAALLQHMQEHMPEEQGEDGTGGAEPQQPGAAAAGGGGAAE